MKLTKKILIGILLITLATFGVACGSGNPLDDMLILDDDPYVDDGDDGEYGDDGGETSDTEDPDGDDPGGSGPGGNDDDDDNDDNDDNGSDYDDDEDGFTENEGDCDDTDDTIYPGAPDKPDYPDYTDSNCDDVDGDLDDAYWTALDGNDANPGTIDQPFLTVHKAASEARSDPANIKDVYIVGGNYAEGMISIFDGVGVYGGYGPLNGEGLRPRNLDTHQTEVDVSPYNAYIGPSTSGQESVVEGLIIRGGTKYPALLVMDASPEIRHNEIYAADTNDGASSTAVHISSSSLGKESRPYFYDNLIQSANASDPQYGKSISLRAIASGGGLVHPTLDSNEIRSGVAGFVSLGVDVFAEEDSEASFTAFKNNIRAESGSSYSIGITIGFDFSTNQTEAFNSANIYQNQISGGSSSMGASIGVAIATSTGIVALTNNFITGGSGASVQSKGIYTTQATVDIINNTINAGKGGMDSTAITLQINSVSNIKNNIFFAEEGWNLIGVAESGANSTPLSLQNNLFTDSLNKLYFDFTNGFINNISTVNSQVDITDCGDNITGLAAFADTSSRDYHLTSNSDAIDAGLDIAEIEVDIDSDNRPTYDEYDIGADEFTDVYNDEDGDDDGYEDGDGYDEDEDGDGYDDWDEDWD